MSELNERLWAVLSERGCEASSLTYGEAAEMMRRLAREKISGLCIVSRDAGSRAEHSEGTPLQKRHKNGTREAVNREP